MVKSNDQPTESEVLPFKTPREIGENAEHFSTWLPSQRGQVVVGHRIGRKSDFYIVIKDVSGGMIEGFPINPKTGKMCQKSERINPLDIWGPVEFEINKGIFQIDPHSTFNEMIHQNVKSSKAAAKHGTRAEAAHIDPPISVAESPTTNQSSGQAESMAEGENTAALSAEIATMEELATQAESQAKPADQSVLREESADTDHSAIQAESQAKPANQSVLREESVDMDHPAIQALESGPITNAALPSIEAVAITPELLIPTDNMSQMHRNNGDPTAKPVDHQMASKSDAISEGVSHNILDAGNSILENQPSTGSGNEQTARTVVSAQSLNASRSHKNLDRSNTSDEDTPSSSSSEVIEDLNDNASDLGKRKRRQPDRTPVPNYSSKTKGKKETTSQKEKSASKQTKGGSIKQSSPPSKKSSQKKSSSSQPSKRKKKRSGKEEAEEGDDSDSDSSDSEYEIDKILYADPHNVPPHWYFVSWVGYDSSANSCVTAAEMLRNEAGKRFIEEWKQGIEPEYIPIVDPEPQYFPVEDDLIVKFVIGHMFYYMKSQVAHHESVSVDQQLAYMNAVK